METKNNDEIIDELNRKIRKNMRMSTICSNLTLMGGALSIAASGYVINCVVKMTGYPGAFATTGASLVGVATCFGIGYGLSKKCDDNVKKYINVRKEIKQKKIV